MGGQPSLTNDERTFRNFMGVAKDKEIKWQYGTTDIQQDGWTCGYRRNDKIETNAHSN